MAWNIVSFGTSLVTGAKRSATMSVVCTWHLNISSSAGAQTREQGNKMVIGIRTAIDDLLEQSQGNLLLKPAQIMSDHFSKEQACISSICNPSL